jgi:hypothetical protein
MRSMRLSVHVALLCGLALASSRSARANGAFPDEFSIHFPPNAPNRILVGANFGLLVSEDLGGSWRYTCEPWVTVGSSDPLSPELVSFYQMTADGAVLATSINLTRSAGDANIGCTWPKSGGGVASKTVTDVFSSPTDPNFVLAIVVTISGSFILGSRDGGATFDSTPLYSTNHLLTGIEISRTSPDVVYATEYHIPSGTDPGGAKLLKTADRFATAPTVWMLPMLPPPPGQTDPVVPQPRILAVDPEDSNTVYLRLLSGNRNSIGISIDGGQNVQIALTVNAQFTSFLRATDRTLYAGMQEGELYVRPPGGTFSSARPAPHLRCLGQRPGTSRIYACGDMFVDNFSIGYSDDGAQTFQPLVKFNEMKGLLTCGPVQTACAAHWERVGCVLGVGTNCGIPRSDGGIQPGGSPPGKSSSCASAGGAGVAALAVIALYLLKRSAAWARRAGPP